MSARSPAALALSLCLTSILAADAAQERIRPGTAYARALELQSQGNQAAALSLLWEAASIEARNADVQNALGEALERIGALDAAVTAYRAALAANPALQKASNNLILALVKAGKGAEAVERARALVAEKPDEAERQFTLALAQSEQDVAGAIESFHRALALAPNHVLARYNLALTLSRVDRNDDAIAELQRAIKGGSRPELHHALGVIYWHQGNLDRAAAELGAAVAANDRYTEAYYALGAVRQAQGDWRGAAVALRRAIAIDPGRPAAHHMLGQVLQRSGDFTRGREELDRAEHLRREAALDQEASVLAAAGTQKLDRGELREALELFRRATAVRNSYAPAFYQMGRALTALGQTTAAKEAFARAQQLNPSLVPARNLP